MQKIFSVLVATILFASCAQDANGLEAIHVEGNRFVDESGNTIVFKGLCLADPVKLYNSPLTVRVRSCWTNSKKKRPTLSAS